MYADVVNNSDRLRAPSASPGPPGPPGHRRSRGPRGPRPQTPSRPTPQRSRPFRSKFFVTGGQLNETNTMPIGIPSPSAFSRRLVFLLPSRF